MRSVPTRPAILGKRAGPRSSSCRRRKPGTLFESNADGDRALAGNAISGIALRSAEVPGTQGGVVPRKRGGRKYGKKAQSKVKRAMHERKRGTLRSGRSGKKVTSRKQAIAIGLSEAREAGAKVPAKRGARKKTAPERSTSHRASSRYRA